MKTKKNISLIGMPAVGKSTVGNLLARETGFKFLDSDDLIQSKEQKTLAGIILQKGLSRFLQIEEKHIVGIDCTNNVIATGGSVVYSKKAMEYLGRISTIIYLSIDLKTLLTRLSDIRSRGVAIGPGRSIEDLYKERTPLYDTYCDIKINCASIEPDKVVEKIVKSIF
ncbi:MAG: shikimate kinase [Deltaproteobacteria bacterium]|nr:shikimate kinase [Deltaproteobacteria bacterium]